MSRCDLISSAHGPADGPATAQLALTTTDIFRSFELARTITGILHSLSRHAHVVRHTQRCSCGVRIHAPCRARPWQYSHAHSPRHPPNNGVFGEPAQRPSKRGRPTAGRLSDGLTAAVLPACTSLRFHRETYTSGGYPFLGRGWAILQSHAAPSNVGVVVRGMVCRCGRGSRGRCPGNSRRWRYGATRGCRF